MISPSERKKGMDDALKNREAWSVILESTSAIIIVVLALIGNIFLCLTIYRFRTRRKIEHYYIFALTISDFLLTLLCVVIAFVVTIIGHLPFGETVCQIQGALIYLSACFSLLNLSLIALNRYFKIVKSASTYQKIYTRKHVLISITTGAVFSAFFVVPFGLQKFCFHAGKVNCFVCKSGDQNTLPIILVPCFILLVITYPVMAFCSLKVFLKNRVHFAQVAESSLHHDDQKLFAAEVKVTKVLFTILIAFLICWTPAFTVEILDTIQGDYSLQRHVYLLMPYTGVANCAVNPIIYGLTQKQFREAYKKIVCCK